MGTHRMDSLGRISFQLTVLRMLTPVHKSKYDWKWIYICVCVCMWPFLKCQCVFFKFQLIALSHVSFKSKGMIVILYSDFVLI